MSAGDETREGFSLRRWSARKRAATREATFEAPPADAEPLRAPLPAASASSDAARASGAPADRPPPLPPVESLSFDSDFTQFMQPTVDESLKHAALKKLFSDPRFNVMDGLDVYVGDYSKPDPLEPGLAKQLAHARYIFDPPQTRANEHGFVEDVPTEAPCEQREGAAPAESPPARGPALDVAIPEPVQQELPLDAAAAAPALRSPLPEE
jgi:hypothetical protein